MVWVEIKVRLSSELADPTSYLFNKYGTGLVTQQVNDNMIECTTYVLKSNKKELNQIDVGLGLLKKILPVFSLKKRFVKETDWKEYWKQHFKTLHISSDLIIQPSWLSKKSHLSQTSIIIDPGLAFGTGHHPTTLMCLELLEKCAKSFNSLLDLGTGSGILAITAAKLGIDNIIALDTDENSIKSAKENAKINNVVSNIDVYLGTIPDTRLHKKEFDIITANISAEVIEEKAKNIFILLKENGRFFASGFMNEKAEKLRNILLNAGFLFIKSHENGEWTTLELSK